MHEEVLIVDDDSDMRAVLVLALQDAGYTTRVAQDGRQALDAVAARMPALVLLDMLMPVMDGWQCARELHARYGQAVRIVVITAAEHAWARAQEVAADDVLPKPFDVDDLLRVVADHVSTGPEHHPPP
ncbi:MAG TPA: response regulator [Myxococcaceae bacterium]|jgi:CheY-like chemotaxis protein